MVLVLALALVLVLVLALALVLVSSLRLRSLRLPSQTRLIPVASHCHPLSMRTRTNPPSPQRRRPVARLLFPLPKEEWVHSLSSRRTLCR